jgi:hypothetical protein
MHGFPLQQKCGRRALLTSDRANAGSCCAFLPLPDISLLLVMIQQRRLMEVSNQTNKTLSTDNKTVLTDNKTLLMECMALASSKECLAESCEWRPQFESCRDMKMPPSGASKSER